MAYRNKRTDDRDKLAKIEEWRYHQVLLVGGICGGILHIGSICARKMRDCHGVKIWEQGKSIESGCGSKGKPSSQDVGAREIHRVRMWEQG